jgi:hypothetical protein
MVGVMREDFEDYKFLPPKEGLFVVWRTKVGILVGYYYIITVANLGRFGCWVVGASCAPSFQTHLGPGLAAPAANIGARKSHKVTFSSGRRRCRDEGQDWAAYRMVG